jgi:hypothetical protein
MSGIVTSPFRPELAAAFRQLNLAWIERLFDEVAPLLAARLQQAQSSPDEAKRTEPRRQPMTVTQERG